MRVRPSKQSLVTQQVPRNRGGILLPRADSRAVPGESRSNVPPFPQERRA